MESIIWFGIFICLTQSAIFSGLNLAFFSVSRLRLEAEAATGSVAASKVLLFRRDSNFLLTTILWGNVGINVLLTLLSNSVLTGLVAFLFSTVVITVAGEIAPQAYFSRRAMKVAVALSPVIRFYQFVLYPVAKPCAWVLDRWLGIEGLDLYKEHHLRGLIEQHIDSDIADVDFIEGQGALNFLEIDDVHISEEGEPIDPASIVTLPTTIDLPVLPAVTGRADDPFIKKIAESGRKWIVLTDQAGDPKLVLDSDAYLRAALVSDEPLNGYSYCHRPVIIKNPKKPLGHIITELKRGMEPSSDIAIVKDIVLLWSAEHRRVITGADILGRLLRGIG